jgi:hypothetical protein
LQGLKKGMIFINFYKDCFLHGQARQQVGGLQYQPAKRTTILMATIATTTIEYIGLRFDCLDVKSLSRRESVGATVAGRLP